MQVSAGDLVLAIERGEFSFFYQPKVSFLTGRVEGAEALIRWRRADGSLVSPSQFIPVAEAHGMTPALTRHMFPLLLDDFARIHAECREDSLAFNVSAPELDDPNLVALVHEAIAASRIAGSQLEIEITEGIAVSREDVIVQRLTGLLDAGVRLAMDDYGTGFSSLDTLNRLPFSALKLDQSFVLRMLRSPKSATLVKTSVAMAQLLGIRSVVEGIETEPVYRALMHYGCTQAQGFWISPPLPLREYLAFRRADARWPCSPVGMLRMAQLTHGWQYKLLVDLLFTYLQHPEVPTAIPHYLHMDHLHCALGQWYYGLGQGLAGDPDFDGLAAPHGRMHDVCNDIMTAVDRHASREVIRDLVGELGQQSCALSATLQRLETRLLFAELP